MIDWMWTLQLLGLLVIVTFVVCFCAVIFSATYKSIKEKK